MKVRINIDGFGDFRNGDIVEATVSNDTLQCYAFDNHNCGWFFGAGQFTIIEESQATKKSEDIVSLKDIIGYDVRTIEFK